MSNKGKISYIMYAIAIWGSFEHRNCVKMYHIILHTYIYFGRLFHSEKRKHCKGVRPKNVPRLTYSGFIFLKKTKVRRPLLHILH